MEERGMVASPRLQSALCLPLPLPFLTPASQARGMEERGMEERGMEERGMEERGMENGGTRNGERGMGNGLISIGFNQLMTNQ